MRVVHVTILAAALALPACSAPAEARGEDIVFSGFLGDGAELQPGGAGKAEYLYVEPGLDLAGFTAVKLDPPQVWLSDEQRAKIGEDQLADLLTALDQALREALGARWDFTDRSAPDVLRVRLAISNATAATGELMPFSRIVPFGPIADQPVKASAGNFLNLGAVHAELELLDGETGKRLAAFVDRRQDTSSMGSVFSTWGDVADACSFWGERLVRHLTDYGMVPTRSGPH